MTLEVKDWEALSAAQYGQLAASKVHYGVHFPEALRRLRLSLPAFERAEDRWVEKLRRAAIEGDRSTLEEFAAAYAAERARLAEDAPRLAPEPEQSTLDPDVTHPPFRRNVAVLPFREAARALLDATRVPPSSSGVTSPNPATPEAPPRDELDGTLMIRSPLASVSQSGFGASLTPTLVPDLSPGRLRDAPSRAAGFAQQRRAAAARRGPVGGRSRGVASALLSSVPGGSPGAGGVSGAVSRALGAARRSAAMIGGSVAPVANFADGVVKSGCRVLKKKWHRFIYGLEHHNGLYWLNIYTGLAPPPLPPAPLPPGMTPAIPLSVHGVQYAATDWFSMDDKGHPKILADGSPIFSRNHTIRNTPHCPPGINVTVISTIAFATSTFKLGVASVQANAEPVASSAAGPAFVTIECADPCSTPTGGGIAPGTVHDLPAPSDWAQAAIEYGLGCVVEFGTSYLFGVFMGSGPMKEVSKRFGDLSRYTSKWFGQKTASDSAREATEKTLRENGYDAFVANEARRQGLNPAKLDDASKKAIDAAFEKEVKEAGEQAAADTASKGSGPAARDATDSWLEKQRKATPENYSAPSNTQPSPTKSHSSKAQKTAEQLEREKNADYAKTLEAPAGDGAKWGAGKATGEGIDEAAKDWSGAPESP